MGFRLMGLQHGTFTVTHDISWEFDEHGLMRLRIARINDLPIKKCEREYPPAAGTPSRQSPVFERSWPLSS